MESTAACLFPRSGVTAPIADPLVGLKRFGTVLLADRRTDRSSVGDFAHCEDVEGNGSGTNDTAAESRAAARSAAGRASAASRTVATVWRPDVLPPMPSGVTDSASKAARTREPRSGADGAVYTATIDSRGARVSDPGDNRSSASPTRETASSMTWRGIPRPSTRRCTRSASARRMSCVSAITTW